MPDRNDNINGWNEWAKHVLAELVRLNECYTTITYAYQDLTTRLVRLEVKVALLGGGLGFAAGIVSSLIVYLITK